jgi:hypothetical protein
MREMMTYRQGRVSGVVALALLLIFVPSIAAAQSEAPVVRAQLRKAERKTQMGTFIAVETAGDYVELLPPEDRKDGDIQAPGLVLPIVGSMA